MASGPCKAFVNQELGAIHVENALRTRPTSLRYPCLRLLHVANRYREQWPLPYLDGVKEEALAQAHDQQAPHLHCSRQHSHRRLHHFSVEREHTAEPL